MTNDFYDQHAAKKFKSLLQFSLSVKGPTYYLYAEVSILLLSTAIKFLTQVFCCTLWFLHLYEICAGLLPQ
jgi:hypothetical protein